MEWNPIMQKLKDADLAHFEAVNYKLQFIDDEMEKIRKSNIMSNIIISGIPEKEKETPAELFQITEDLFANMGLPQIDYSYISRKGKKIAGKPRIVQVKLVRQKDKYLIYSKKAELMKTDSTKSIFIRAEQTPLERSQEYTLRKAGKFWQTSNPTLKFSIRNGTMTMTQDGQQKQFTVTRDGDIQEKDGTRTTYYATKDGGFQEI